MEQTPKLPKLRTPDRDFIRAEVYGIYKAITELFGEKAWQVIWRSGEIVFDEAAKQLEFPKKDPISVINVLGKYLVKSGYCTKIEAKMAGKDLIQYDVWGPSMIRPAITKLKAEGCVLPHWSTVVIVAGLEKVCKVKVETDVKNPELISDIHAREWWRFSSIR